MGDMHPVYSAMLEQRRQAGVVDFSKLSPEECRAYARGAIAAAPPAPDLPELAYVGDEMFEAPQGAIRLRRYRPAGAVKGSCMYFHGGGWLLGDLDTSDRTCRRIAGLGGLEVVSVDFRLAPEHPWPSPFEDCYAVTVGVERHSGPLFVAGDSAGGNLAAAVAIRARDEDGPEIAGQIFFYPVTDHDLTTGSYRELGERSLLLTTAAMRYFWDHYCPDPAERANPLVSPLRVASAAGLPPVFLAVGELDVLRDEGVAFARKLEEAGVPVELRVDPGMLHGYITMPEQLEPARGSLDAMRDWIRRIVG